MNVNIIRSRRKTISLLVNEQGLIVRAPYRMSQKAINDFIVSNQKWIDKQLLKVKNQKIPDKFLSAEDIKELMRQAVTYIPGRVEYFSNIIGVTYGKITIRNQKTIWGSCTAAGNLNFNCLLMLAPKEVLDSVVVHELCHRKYMNHSKAFYELVKTVYPEYDKWNGWLKSNGNYLIRQMTG